MNAINRKKIGIQLPALLSLELPKVVVRQVDALGRGCIVVDLWQGLVAVLVWNEFLPQTRLKCD